MAAISQQLADITVLSIVVRILLSTFCAGTLGFERERHNQAAGFRTYIIVSDASALVMMTNIFVAGIGETDLVRMSASVITGLGFLGAGTILVTRNQEVRGLTTAAGLWAVAIIGTAFGAGFYAGGIICYAFIFLAMQVLRRVDLRIRKTQRVSTGSVVEGEVYSALVGVHPPEGVGVEPAKEAGRLFDNHFSSISLVMAGPRLWGRIANLLRCCRLRAWLCISVGFLRPRPLRLAF